MFSVIKCLKHMGHLCFVAWHTIWLDIPNLHQSKTILILVIFPSVASASSSYAYNPISPNFDSKLSGIWLQLYHLILYVPCSTIHPDSPGSKTTGFYVLACFHIVPHHLCILLSDTVCHSTEGVNWRLFMHLCPWVGWSLFLGTFILLNGGSLLH